jgi:hypothetical protein
VMLAMSFGLFKGLNTQSRRAGTRLSYRLNRRRYQNVILKPSWICRPGRRVLVMRM